MGDEQAINPHPLHEALAAVLANHEREHGAHAEHLCVEVDVRDLRDWEEHARANYGRGWELRRENAALRAGIERVRDVWLVRGASLALSNEIAALVAKVTEL